MANFNVGQFITGNANNGYSYTNKESLCGVLQSGLYGDPGLIMLGILARADGTRCLGEYYEVNADAFVATTAKDYFTIFPSAYVCSESNVQTFERDFEVTVNFAELLRVRDEIKNKPVTQQAETEPWKAELSDEQRKELHDEIMTLLTTYKHKANAAAVTKIIDEWLKNKYPLIQLLKRHPNYNGRFQIVFDHDYERTIDKNMIQNFCAYMHGSTALHKNILTELYIPPFTYTECKSYAKKFENWYYLLSEESYKIRQINGMGREEILENHKRWADKLNAYQSRGKERNGKRYTVESIQLYENAKNFLAFLHSYFQTTLSKDAAEVLNRYIPDIKAKSGQKTSRVMNKFCKMFGLDQMSDYNKRFAEYSDAINPLKIKRHTILSVHPVDYLTMSFGNSWASCHTIDINNIRNTPKAYHGEYRSGTLSYMLDGASMVLYTVDAKYEGNEYELQDKINRNMFHFGEGKLIQGRVYPQDNDGENGIYTVFREITQQIMSECIENGVNSWLNVKGTAECTEVTYSHGTHYKDYRNYSNCNVSYYNKEKNMNAMHIGHRPICIKCGNEHEYTDRLICRRCR